MEEHLRVLGVGKVARIVMTTGYMILGWRTGFLTAHWPHWPKSIPDVPDVILFY
ncbi:MAG: hypothetical protein K0S67_25 [Nitrososphaeraceae archaeon]|jgi:hypothetical protein|nr:hypothetical protein [Nitrososphaeraceae archaeon]